jgi:hypothetical protein
MAFRESINKKPAIATGAAIGIIIAFSLVIYFEKSSGAPKTGALTMAYYTVDDGATYYADSIDKIPPCDYNGHQAVRAYLYRCNGGKPFVAYLEAFTPDAKKAIESSGSGPAFGGSQLGGDVPFNRGRLLKAPLTGDKGWLREGQPGFSEVSEIHCPAGESNQDIEPVYP